MDKTSEAILALKPVSFRYKKEIDPDRQRNSLVRRGRRKGESRLSGLRCRGESVTISLTR